jgi:Pectate lyase
MKFLALKMALACCLMNALVPVQAATVDDNRMQSQVLKTGGWADYGSGTMGGSEARQEHIFTVTNKKELVEALNGGPTGRHDTPKIIYIQGTIDINVDANNNPVGREYYADPEYCFTSYIEEYSPENWGMEKEPSGPLEDARARSARNQANEIKLRVGSNTTIIGLGNNARIIGGSFVLARLNSISVNNIIIRNLQIDAPVDFFPEWDPTDGNFGEWNSEYDAIEINQGAHHIWITNNTLTGGDHPDKRGGEMFGRTFMEYDGLLDITNQSNYITASYNIFHDFDKVTIIGASDRTYADRGHLKVTLHNNYYKNTRQRTPRIRFGEVHLYNNYYELTHEGSYPSFYAWGVGVESKGYYENNYFSTSQSMNPSRLIRAFNGNSIYESGSYVNGVATNILALYNAANPTAQLDSNVGWKPTFYNEIRPTHEVPAHVKANAGVRP